MREKFEKWLLMKCPLITLRVLTIGTCPWPEISIMEIETEGYLGSLFHMHLTDSGYGLDVLYIVSLWRYLYWDRRCRAKKIHTS